ncbi:MAG TPA: FKBP-type peptidyl-prolyl cis-trans isomerase [Bacteroidales bacterium]|nr:FKBP-type peptidyl-prolyl cis-trans isomerase [Bacteroidales bacterium]
MKTGKNTVVTLTYTLRLDNVEGEIVELVQKENPAVFLLGAGNLLDKFEQNLDGLVVGDAFSFGLTSTEGYGMVEEDAIVEIPLQAFEVDGQLDMEMLELGNMLPMRDSEGNLLHGKVAAVDEEYVTMDFNHPLAGKDLH